MRSLAPIARSGPSPRPDSGALLRHTVRMDGDSYDLGVQMGQRGDFAEARRLFQLAGEDARALLALGQLASNGYGEQEDPAKAAKFYWRAANLGSGEAAYNLGALYGKGRGVPQDPDTALQWYAKAGELGCPAGYRAAGTMYAAGDGRPVDVAQAEPWWLAAARAGDADAMAQIGRVFADYRNDPITAAEWYLKARDSGYMLGDQELLGLRPKLEPIAGAGDVRAAKALGVILLNLVQDEPGAIGALTLPAERGDATAQRMLALLIMRRPERDNDRILRLLDTSARAGDGYAAYTLTGMFARGDGVQADLNIAAQWARLAIGRGVIEAYALMAAAMPRDEDALRWYQEGAAAGDPTCITEANARLNRSA